MVNETQHPLRMLIAGGGTGGHVLPAIAVIEELRARQIPHELLWVGGTKGVESQIAAEQGIRFVAIPTGKLRRYFSVENLIDAARIPGGIIAGWHQVRRFHPDVIYSTGGAVSVPTLVLGHYLSPVITHEQTAQVGLANKVASKYATTFAVGFEEAAVIARKLNKNVVVTGNPVRASLRQGEKSRGLARFGFTTELPVLYVTGGARGASPLNDRIAALLPDLLAHTQILHQAGPKSANDDVTKLENLQRSWPEHLQKRYRVVPFVGAEMPDVYAMTDLVIARSGAGTVSELAFAGLPSVLIPLPGTWGDEQTKNAQVLAAAGAAVVLPQPEATPERLRTELVALLHDPDRRNRMAAAALRIAQPNAAANLLDEILKLRK